MSFVVFIILYLSPGDPFSVLLEGQLSSAEVARRIAGSSGYAKIVVCTVLFLVRRHASWEFRYFHTDGSASSFRSAARRVEHPDPDHRLHVHYATDRYPYCSLFRGSRYEQNLLASNHVCVRDFSTSRFLAWVYYHLFFHAYAWHISACLWVFKLATKTSVDISITTDPSARYWQRDHQRGNPLPARRNGESSSRRLYPNCKG